MKKIFLVFLIAVLALNLVACGEDESKNVNVSVEIDKDDDVSEEVTNGIIKEVAEKYGNLNEFETVDFEGEKYTQENFEGFDIIMVNFWATFCGPCIRELPELGELSEELPENVKIVGVCTDYKGNEALAKKLLEDSGVKYENILLSEDMQNSMAKNFQYVPTTVFLDSQGNIIGNIKVGAPSGDVKEEYLSLINAALKAIGK